MTITILTLFPEFFTSILDTSILKRAQAKELVTFKVIDIRDFTNDAHKTADDRPFGGGAGMVMKVEPIALALDSLDLTATSNDLKRTILTSAKGTLFNQDQAKALATLEELVIICGHYQGVDQRVADNLADEEVRIGDYVLTGGEVAAAVMIDAVTRLVPGVLGNEQSPIDESHSEVGKGSYPDYTRPEVFRGWEVPPVLLSGDHQEIKNWRQKNKKQLADAKN